MKNRKRYLRYKEKLKKISRNGVWYEQRCPSCGEKIFYYDKYDATCCMNCDIWLDDACDDPECPYCPKRPSSPSMALFLEEDRDEDKITQVNKNK